MSELEERRTLNIQRRIWRLRREGKTFEDVSTKIEKEFNQRYSLGQIKDLYNQYAAKASVVTDTMKNLKREATAVRREWEKEIDEMIEMLNDRIKKYLNMGDKFMKESFDSDNKNAFFRDLPAFIKLLKSLQDQIRLLREAQNKIQLNQQNLILNKTQILQLVNQTYKEKEKETGMVIHPATGELIPIEDFKKRKKKILV